MDFIVAGDSPTSSEGGLHPLVGLLLKHLKDEHAADDIAALTQKAQAILETEVSLEDFLITKGFTQADFTQAEAAAGLGAAVPEPITETPAPPVATTFGGGAATMPGQTPIPSSPSPQPNPFAYNPTPTRVTTPTPSSTETPNRPWTIQNPESAQRNQEKLQSEISWEDLKLPEALLTGVQLMNFARPSQIQATTLPTILDSQQNLIAQAPSGTGKTACFVLGALAKLNPAVQAPQAIILTNTRELAQQVAKEVRKMGQKIPGLKAITCVPGYDFSAGVTAQVVVGPPGRVCHAVQEEALPIQNLKMFVMDEADVMVEHTQSRAGGNIRAGVAADAARLCNKVRKEVPDCQVGLFSATFPAEVRKFALAMCPNAKKFIVTDDRCLNLEYIHQFNTQVTEDDKFRFLMDIYQVANFNQSIIFVNTRATAKALTGKMIDNGFKCAVLQAEMTGEERDHICSQFRDGACRFLIATNLLARGVDIPDVSLVVNYEVPLGSGRTVDPETYLHRIGRCGRFGRPGVAINMLASQQDVMDMNRVADKFNIPLIPLQPTVQDFEAALQRCDVFQEVV